jgi:hypothetical protein
MSSKAKAAQPAAAANSSAAKPQAPTPPSVLDLLEEAVRIFQRGYDLSGDPGMGDYLRRAKPVLRGAGRKVAP